MMLVKILTFAFLALVFNLNAQETSDTTNHIDKVDHIDHHRNEVGIANSLVYLVNEKEFVYGLHTHFVTQIPETDFGVGIGYERLFGDHKHNTIGLIGSYTPYDHLTFSLSPGVSFEDQKGSDLNFALHLETAYEIEISNFHIGPVVEFGYDPEDFHVSIGLHIGYGF